VIEFHYEDTDFRLENPQILAEWVTQVIEGFGRPIAEINYIFCSDEYLWRMNVEYLGHEDYTDILTFDLSEPGAALMIDMFISVERVADNARGLNADFRDELHRVMIHGVLHSLGFDDGDDEQKRRMRSAEDQMLALRQARS
jgi:rRNA maturation RNase YbeY